MVSHRLDGAVFLPACFAQYTEGLSVLGDGTPYWKLSGPTKQLLPGDSIRAGAVTATIQDISMIREEWYLLMDRPLPKNEKPFKIIFAIPEFKSF
jgi:hypothetical protein